MYLVDPRIITDPHGRPLTQERRGGKVKNAGLQNELEWLGRESAGLRSELAELGRIIQIQI